MSPARLRSARVERRRGSCVGALALAASCALAACEQPGRFSTGKGSLEGVVEGSDLVRAGFAAGTRVCLELDTRRLQEKPGTLSSSDGRFSTTALRPIPPLTSDTLSNLSFAEGQVRNLVFAVRERATPPRDALAVVTLRDDDRVELRLLDGAPGAEGPEPLYGVFALERKETPCSY
jgi:hypothetical protein